MTAPALSPLRHRALYAAFDRVPSPKGAATHIEKFASTLLESFAGGLIHVLGDDGSPRRQREGSAEIIRYNRPHDHFLDRTLGYGKSLSESIDRLEPELELCHFRDPWSGIPILNRPRKYATVYEVNGLPSIELPYAYPLLGPRTLDKVRQAERYCWEQSDAIVTPSRTIAGNLVGLGADARKIEVIPNGADPSPRIPPRPPDAPDRYFLYFGALQAWQGVDVLMRAFQLLSDLPDLRLVICASSHKRLVRPYLRLAERLGLADRIIWRQGLGRSELAGWVAHAAASVAPFTECSRNLDQGCAPLKLLESMAYGTPIVASDIPAVREILEAGSEARLIHPDRPAELARALRIVLEYPAAAAAMGLKAKARLERQFTWSHSLDALRTLYHSRFGGADPRPEIP